MYSWIYWYLNNGTFFPLYATTVDFKSDNEEVIEVQTFSFNSGYCSTTRTLIEGFFLSLI